MDSDYDYIYNDPSYDQTFVYGNVLYETGDDGNSQIVHYGGDSGITTQYRNRWLYFYNNTVVSKRTGHTTLFRLSSAGQSADARDNIFYVTATGNQLAFLDQDGTLVAHQNWVKTGYAQSFSGGSITDNGEVTGASPGFTDLASDDFSLAAGSPCLDVAIALDPATASYAPLEQYVKHQMFVPRPSNGAPDLGAFERPSAVSVDPLPQAGSARFSAYPNPFGTRCDVRQVGGRMETFSLEVFDTRGRLMARVPAQSPGSWTLAPTAAWPNGLYFVRAPGVCQPLVLLR